MRRLCRRLCGRCTVAMGTGALALLAGLGMGQAQAQPTGTIRGRVLNSLDSRPYTNVQISLEGTGFAVLTNATGQYLLPSVPVGDYTVQARVLGYQVLEETAVVTAGATSVVSFDFGGGWAPNIPPVQPNTRLDSLRGVYVDSLGLLPLRDAEDRSRLPGWFRAFLRHSLPLLPRSGPLQYPLSSTQLFHWMLLHQDLREGGGGGMIVTAGLLPTPWTPPPFPDAAASVMDDPGRSVIVGGTNVNLSNADRDHDEASVAIDPGNQEHVLAAANNIGDTPAALMAFRSSDGGCSWLSNRLPIRAGESFQADPSVAWGPDGTGWVAALVKDWSNQEAMSQIQLFKTEDGGSHYRHVATASEGTGNDKEMLAVAPPGSPFEGRIYLAWSQLNGPGVRFRWAENQGSLWSEVMELSNRPGVGTHVVVGSRGEVYVAWASRGLMPTDGPSIVVRVSWNGGESFGSPVVVAPIRATGYRISVPGACTQMPLIYPVLATSPPGPGSPHGRLYAVWMDLDRVEAPDPGCQCVTCGSGVNTNIYFSLSTDQGKTWLSEPVRLPPLTPKTDEFNPWVDVDPSSGHIHVGYYTTEPGHRTRTHFYYAESRDGGRTFQRGNAPLANAWSDDVPPYGLIQYGDYAGLAALKGIVLPLWTDHRGNLTWNRHQVFSATVEARAPKELRCPAMTLSLFPRALPALKRGQTREVMVRLMREGRGVEGEWVKLDAATQGIARIEPSSDRTGAEGRAYFQVTGTSSGATEILVTGGSTLGTIPVRVESGLGGWPWWLWALIILGAVALGLFLVFVRSG